VNVQLNLILFERSTCLLCVARQQYAIGAIVCQVQDLLGFGCLPAAAVSRAARLAVDLLGALSSSGSSDESDNETLLAPVPSCAALLCLLSTARYACTGIQKKLYNPLVWSF